MSFIKEEIGEERAGSDKSDDVDDKDIGDVEMLDFGAPQADKPADKKLILPLLNRNKILPIIEVPSSDSDRSDFKQQHIVPDR